MKFNVSLLVALVTTMASAADGDVRVIPGTVTHRMKEARSDNGPTNVIIRDEELEFEIKDDQPRYGRLTIAFNAPSCRYYWTFQTEGSRRGSDLPGDLGGAPFITIDTFVVFYASHQEPLVRECKGDALDSDDAELKILRKIRLHLHDAAYGRPLSTHQVINLGLPSEFVVSPGNSFLPPTVIQAVVHDGDKWRLTLKNRWTVEVLLDADYHLIETKRVEALLPYH
jgi:hypothetical protein